ncbi:thioredoxin family protein [Salinicoccus halitifaciens]|uniref:Thiol-disulfide isomerase/thioredoxin n=1 Tax=Salinicoccus halitifaciens TaxID=1073415 RepID=A0ABV2ECP4_9STAP|nr:thioredoxin family protein [Salinicoccus halitifaciens]MCD2138992.1 thioredoxin family protein [Salinicoccus halitifaciens]
MGNKIFYGIIAAIVVAFIAIFIVMNNNSSEPDQLSDSGYYPYTDMEPEALSGPTIDALDNEDYHYNQTPAEVAGAIEDGDGQYVYFWSPTCPHCLEATPLLVDAFEQADEDLIQLNVLEYEEPWSTYELEATPTLIYFEDGEEVERITGNPGDVESYESFIAATSGE